VVFQLVDEPGVVVPFDVENVSVIKLVVVTSVITG